MPDRPEVNLWSSTEHALDYLRRADSIPHRVEGEATLLEFLPRDATRILDLGSGAGRLLALTKASHPNARFVALDFSPAMLDALNKVFAGEPAISIVTHDMDNPLPSLGEFDAIISSFAIHHLRDARKRSLYQEIFEALAGGGIFCNLEHVASPTPSLHEAFLEAIGWPDEDPSNKLADLEVQLGWLREIGYDNVDCHWKWRELALFAGQKPANS